jgi:serine/threonine-protein kinase RsbW
MEPGQLLFHLAIDSRFESIEVVQVVLCDVLERFGVDEDGRHWIDIAVREAVANAIKHGNREDPAKKVEVDLLLADGDLVIRVMDRGAGFDPALAGDPLAPANLQKASGRGLFFMRKFMDGVDFAPRHSGGMVVTLRKKGPFSQINLRSKAEQSDHGEERAV